MVKLFRKKSVIIEAIQLTLDNWNIICDFIPKPYFDKGVYLDDNNEVITSTTNIGKLGLLINTLESNKATGSLLAIENDWIIKGIKGEFYPCKPDIFENTYELVENNG